MMRGCPSFQAMSRLSRRSLIKVGTVSKSAGFEQTVRVPLNAANAGPVRVVAWVGAAYNPVLGAAWLPLAPGSTTP